MRVACFINKSETMFAQYFENLIEAHEWQHICIDSYSDDMLERLHAFSPDVLISRFSFDNHTVQELLATLEKSSLATAPLFLFSVRSAEREAADEHLRWINNFENIKIVNKTTLIPSLRAVQTMQQKQDGESTPKTILYVDDSKVMHSFFGGSVEESPYNIIEAYSGEEALKLYNEFLPDMVITDVEMPGMNGLELCREIKEHNFANRFIPVLILSSREEPLDIKTGFEYGADDYLTKPVDKTLLLEKIEEYFSVSERKSASKVLVLEYDRLHGEKISHTIIKNGFSVLRAFDAHTAIKFMEDERPEIAVISLDMPDIDGLDFIRNLRSNNEYDDISFIAVTKKTPDEALVDASVAAKYGITKVYYKPFDLTNFSLLLERLLSEKYASYKRENKLTLEIISVLITLLEARDKYTKGHTMRVSQYAMLLGKELKLSHRDLDMLMQAAKFHDLGKIGIRDDVLLKPAKLTDNEYKRIQQHSKMSAEMLEPLDSFKEIIPLILYHHERWDGKGYPEGIHGTDIPLGARIIAVADTYDAMTTDRPYRKALSHEKAIKLIGDNAATQFCPRCVKCFLNIPVELLHDIHPR